jgi:hypothetical protein
MNPNRIYKVCGYQAGDYEEFHLCTTSMLEVNRRLGEHVSLFSEWKRKPRKKSA